MTETMNQQTKNLLLLGIMICVIFFVGIFLLNNKIAQQINQVPSGKAAVPTAAQTTMTPDNTAMMKKQEPTAPVKPVYERPLDSVILPQ